VTFSFSFFGWVWRCGGLICSINYIINIYNERGWYFPFMAVLFRGVGCESIVVL
jgi:hypothetical protein